MENDCICHYINHFPTLDSIMSSQLCQLPKIIDILHILKIQELLLLLYNDTIKCVMKNIWLTRTIIMISQNIHNSNTK